MTRQRKQLINLVKSWAQDHTAAFHVVVDPDATDTSLEKTQGFFTWVIQEKHANIDLLTLVDRIELLMNHQRQHKYADGSFCVECGNWAQFAEPNQEDGSFICYSCSKN